jgi:uncharacterized membrane protein YgaE (UPF0421/DUF939 family)
VTRSPFKDTLQLSARAASAAGLSVAIARLAGLPYPIYALLAAVIVTDLSPDQTRRLGLPRLAGTFVGATLGAALSPLLGETAWGIGLGVFAAMTATNLLRLTRSARVSGYVCGIVLLVHSDHPWSYAGHRSVETILGIGVAVIVSLVPHLFRYEDPPRHDGA